MSVGGGMGVWGRGYVVYRNFQQYFSYIMAVRFIGGGTRRTRRKPLTNLIT